MSLGRELVWRQPGKPRIQAAHAFLPLMRAAVESHPDDVDLLLDLVIALRNADQHCEIVDRLAPMAGSHGLPPELAVELGAAAKRRGDMGLARMALDMAMDDGAPAPILRDPAGRSAARQRACVELSSVLTASGEHHAALRAVTEALDLNPHDDGALSVAADQMLQQGHARALIALLDDLQRRGVRSTTLLSCRANALGACGAHAELERLVSPAQWCAQAMIGSDEIDSRRLSEVILTHPALAASPGDRPTRGTNHRLDTIAGRDEPELRAMVSTIRRHVDAYVAARRDVPHPLMSHMPAAAVLQGWALATNGDGHEPRHIHAGSWLTAVYYARVPVAARRGAGPPPGSIVFGPWPSDAYPCASAFPAWHLEPREGMLLIFPSFMAHSTVPAGVDEPRLCVTLDTMPRGLPA